MDTFESTIRFIGSYPMWARLLVLACIGVTAGTLVLAPRSTATSSVVSPTKEHGVFMLLAPIKLFPPSPTAEVQLSVFVNGTEYRHPSVAGVEWMRVGPAMSEKIIELPVAPRYEVRFELRLRDGSQGQTKLRLRAAQKISYITSLPFSEEYSLYDIDGTTRSAGVSAVVAYKVYAQ
ncbi:MAG: hypothetical protein AB7K09_16565 [Planctomycetota bacterium]